MSSCSPWKGVKAFDWVHALAHWIEADFGNADYWYRQAGERRTKPSVAEEWAYLVETLSEKPAGLVPGAQRAVPDVIRDGSKVRFICCRLLPDQLQPAPRYLIGAGGLRADRLAAPELLEQPQRAAGEQPAIAVVALNVDDLSALVFESAYVAALRQNMQDTLFVPGNVHFGKPEIGVARERHRVAAMRRQPAQRSAGFGNMFQ